MNVLLALIIAALLLLLPSGIIVFIVVMGTEYGYCRAYREVVVPFKYFKQLYFNLPDKWELYENYAIYHGQRIGFNFIGFIRYYFFYRGEKNVKKKAARNAAYKRFLKNAKFDVEKEQERIHRETIERLQEIREETNWGVK